MLKKLTYSIGISLASLLLLNSNAVAQIVISPPTATIGVLCPTCITGSLTSGRVVIASGVATVTDDAGLTYIAATDTLTTGAEALSLPAGSYGLTFTPIIDNWTGAILVNVDDIASLSGSAFVIRVLDTNSGVQSFDLDAWGSAQIKETVAGGSGSAAWNWVSESAARSYGQIASNGIVFKPLSGDIELASPNGTALLHVENTGVSIDSPIVSLNNGTALTTDTVDAHTMLISGYDVNAAAYVPFVTVLNANAPSFTLAPSGDGTVSVNATTLSQASKAITLGGALTTSGANALTLTTTGSTNVTLPTSGTLVTSTVATLSSLASIGTVTTGTWSAGTVTARHVMNGSTPSVANVGANSCGTTTATIAGNDNAGLITVGTVAGTQCRITFTAAAPNRWQCAANNETTANLLRTTYIDTTHVDILGTMVAGDSLSYICAPR